MRTPGSPPLSSNRWVAAYPQPMITRASIFLLLWIVPLHCFVIIQPGGHRHGIGHSGSKDPLRCIAPLRRSSCTATMTIGVVEEKIKQLGITLPDVSPPAGSYVLCRRSANTLYLSGHLPKALDGSLTTGKVGADVDVEKAAEAARLVAINLIATMKASAGDLDKVRLIKITGFVQSADGFTSQPQVVNGASNLFLEIFGKDKGAHARSAVGVNALPLGVCVEIEAIVEVEP